MIVTKVKEDPSFVRDEHTQALLNTNNAALAEYKARKKQNRKLNGLDDRIQTIEDKLERLDENIERLILAVQGKQ